MSEPEPKHIGETIQEYLRLYADQQPHQAELLLPRWAFDRLAQTPEPERQRLLDMVDAIAHDHGLLTPTNITVVVDPPTD